MTIVAKCRRMLDMGERPEVIVSMLGAEGRDHGAVRRVLKELGSPVAREPINLWTPEEEAKIVALRAAGKTVTEIAQVLPGRTPKSVESRVKKMKIPSRVTRRHFPRDPDCYPSKALEEADDRRIELFHSADGLTEAEVYQRFGRAEWVTKELAYLVRCGLLRLNGGKYRRDWDRDVRCRQRVAKDRLGVDTVTEGRAWKP